jgi:hypothetical protein
MDPTMNRPALLGIDGRRGAAGAAESLAVKTLAGPPRAASAFVWGAWVLMWALGMAVVWNFSTRVVPHSDEIGLIVDASFSPAWLWAQHAEHRIPLAKLIWLGVLKATDYDFRVGNFLDVTALAAVAAGMILAARAVRGWTSFSDALFPLAILNPAQAMDFIWWITVHQILPSLLASGVLLIIVVKGTRLGCGYAAVAGVCLVLLSLSGPGGLPLVLALGLWLVYWCVRSWRSWKAAQRLKGLAVLGLVTVAVCLVGLYYVGYQNDPDTAAGVRVSDPGLKPRVAAGIQLLCLSLGTATEPAWQLWGLGILTLCVVSVAALARAWYRQPEQRVRVLGLFLFLAAMGSLVFAMGWVRAGLGENYIFVGHYIPRVFPVLCVIVLILELYGKRGLAFLIQMCLFTALCVLLLPNWDRGRQVIGWFDYQRALERDLRAGVPPFILAEHYGESIIGGYNEEAEMQRSAAELFRRARQANIGVFRDMRPDPAYREVPLPVEPVRVRGMTWEKGIAYGNADNANLTFALKEPRKVYAIRLKYAYQNRGEPAQFQLGWTGRQPAGRAGKERNVTLPLKRSPEDRVVTIWVNDTLDRFRIVPDQKLCVMRIADIRLLVPET